MNSLVTAGTAVALIAGDYARNRTSLTEMQEQGDLAHLASGIVRRLRTETNLSHDYVGAAPPTDAPPPRAHVARLFSLSKYLASGVARHLRTETDLSHDYVGAAPAMPPTDAQFPSPDVVRLFSLPKYTDRPQTRSLACVVLAEWEGTVLEIASDCLRARLIPVKGLSTSGESDAEIPWEEVSDSDRVLVRAGAPFRLTVGYEIARGTRSRFSRIVFRRLPVWTRRDLEKADDLATQRYNAISVE